MTQPTFPFASGVEFLALARAITRACVEWSSSATWRLSGGPTGRPHAATAAAQVETLSSAVGGPIGGPGGSLLRRRLRCFERPRVTFPEPVEMATFETLLSVIELVLAEDVLRAVNTRVLRTVDAADCTWCV